MLPALKVVALRFEFRAVDTIRIPPGKAGNVFRGGFGAALRELACTPECPGATTCDRASECAYALLFEPRRREGPSGFGNPPRPFVIRAADLEGSVVLPGQRFSTGVHLFGDPMPGAADWFRRVFAALAPAGIGASRGRAELVAAETREPVLVSVAAGPGTAHRFAIDFLTPTDLKAQGAAQAHPGFHTVFARARDRVAALMAIYGSGAPEVDYRALGETAKAVRASKVQVASVMTERRSSRTGQRHGVGGFVGRAEYEGEASALLPWLRAAWWTGIGRHTVWGNGVIRVTEYP